jgi:hypothetical protein
MIAAAAWEYFNHQAGMGLDLEPGPGKWPRNPRKNTERNNTRLNNIFVSFRGFRGQ